MPGGRGEGGARGRGLISLAPGRSGHHVCRHYDRHARCVAGSGEIRRRSDPRPLDGLPTKPGPGRTKGPHTPWEDPRWNAGQASAPESGRRGASRSFRGAPRTHLVRVVWPASAGVPLPFICRRRVAKSCSATAQTVRSGLDGSPISVNGGGKQNALFDITRAHMRSRDRDRASSPLPAARGEVERSEGEGTPPRF
jgi:hypothetical protein